MTGKFRKASEDDSMMLFEWANDPDTRKNSLNSAPIEFSAHKNWLAKTLSDPHRILLIYEDVKPVGTVRLDITDSSAVLSYSIAPKERGKGYGTAIIKDILEYIEHGTIRVKKIIATVKPENAASRSVFLKNNFFERKAEGNLVYEIEFPQKTQ